MPLRTKKSAPLRRSRERHDQAPNKKSGRGAQSGGIRLAQYTLRNHLPSFLFEIWSFSREARYTVTRITLFQFADTTSMSVPQFKDFSGARELASSPALNKDQRSYSFRPKNTQIVSLTTAPRQSPRPAQTGMGCDLKVLKRSAGGIATRRARPIRFVVDPRPLA